MHPPVFLAALVVLTSLASSRGATLRVPSEYATIQAAIDASALGDTVEIACGVYAESGLSIAHDLVIRSETGTPDCVTIDAAGTGPLLLCGVDSHLGLFGLTLANATQRALNAENARSLDVRDCIFRNNSGNQGAAIIFTLWDASSIVRCDFVENHATAYEGGALHGWSQTGLSVRECRFVANTAPAGGAALLAGPCQVERCSFEGNSAHSVGALYTSGSVGLSECSFVGNTAVSVGALRFGNSAGTTVASDCVFRDNSAQAAGAVEMRGDNTRMIACRFEGNSATDYGGAIFLGGGGLGRLERCSFRGNVAARGGAVSASFATLVIIGSTFFENWASQAGGAVWVDASAQAAIYGSTLVRNGTAGEGAGVWLKGSLSTRLTLQRTIIAFSTAGAAAYRSGLGLSAFVQCTDIFGNAGGDWVGFLGPHANQNLNFAADPLFCDAEQEDLTLRANSSCAPDNSPSGCGLVGALPAACGTVASQPLTWGQIKAAYR